MEVTEKTEQKKNKKKTTTLPYECHKKFEKS